jgi:ribonuclease PH
MNSFSVSDRIKPGQNRRAIEISKISGWALEPVVDLKKFPNQVMMSM